MYKREYSLYHKGNTIENNEKQIRGEQKERERGEKKGASSYIEGGRRKKKSILFFFFSHK
jgi:hypothetical protein